MNTQDMISIKAKHQNEIRRFALPLKSTYATLETSLNSLFTLSGPVIKYTDDEGDLCTISTQQEFDYAVSTTKGLLRLHLFSPEDLKASATTTPVASATPQIPLNSSQECPQKHFLLEKMDNKHAQLISKRDDLKSKLASDSLNSERRRVLSWKLEKIEEKISMLEQRRKNMAHHLQNPGEGGHQHPWRGARGAWGGGRGGRGGHHGPHHGGHFEHGAHHDWPHHHHGAEHDWAHHGPPPHHGGPGHFEHHGPPAHHDWPHHGPPAHHFEHHGPPHHQHPEGGHQQKEQRWLDWMDKRQANLTSKRDSLNAKIGEEGITPQRKAILTEKLTKVQDKLSALELRRQQLADGVHPCVKGAGRRGGRGGWGKHAAGQCEQQTTADSTTPKNEETK